MKLLTFGVLAVCVLTGAARHAADPAYFDEIKQWREDRDKILRADNGWLTLAGRFRLKEGINTFGTGKDNDVVFPHQLKGTGPERLGTLVVDTAAKKVTLKLSRGVSMVSDNKPFSGERDLGTDSGKRDWVSLGRISMHIIERDGRYILRLADNESAVRKKFAGRVWYAPDEKYRVEATFVPYAEGKTLSIVNIVDEVSKQPCPGYLEFKLNGATHRLDALADDGKLFLIFMDDTSGEDTYGSGRFIQIDRMPKGKETITLDFNKAYNPPCAFSDFTTCPLPPKQNFLKTRIEAGEKYRKNR